MKPSPGALLVDKNSGDQGTLSASIGGINLAGGSIHIGS
jgi:hypothetical protein